MDNSIDISDGINLKDVRQYFSECKKYLQVLVVPLVAFVAIRTPYVILSNQAIPPDPIPPGYSTQLWYYLFGYYDYFYHDQFVLPYDAPHLFFLTLNAVLILLMILLMLNRVTVRIAFLLIISVVISWILGCMLFFGGWIDWIMTPIPGTPLTCLCFLPLYTERN
ncbi:MAG: hypothetical protein ACTSV2_02510 [Candidatus Thorarchaeota archaeon]